MRVVALEEHFTVPALVQRIDQNAIIRRGFRSRNPPTTGPNPLELLPEIGQRRLQSMDEAGITVQVLSNSGPGPDLVPGPDGVAFVGGTLAGANTPAQGNFSHQDITVNAAGVQSIKLTGLVASGCIYTRHPRFLNACTRFLRSG